MTTEMLISIVIPLYNKEFTISRAVHSVLRQTHQEFELIIVNDGSTDGSLAAARKFTDARIRIVEQANRGVSAARNEGVRQACSEWVAFLDGDDEYLPGFLETMLAFIKEHQSRRLSFLACNLIYGATGVASFPEVATGLHNYFTLCRPSETPATSSSTVVRRQAFLLAGGFPEGVRQYEDWVLWCKLAWLGEFGFVSQPLARYHLASAGTASTSEREATAYYADLTVLPGTVEAWMRQGRVPEELVPASWRYLNAYVMGQTRALRRKRERRLAWRFMAQVKPRHLDFRLLVMACNSVILLLLPMGLKRSVTLLWDRLRPANGGSR